jgi:hypothetical protein
VRGEQQEKTSGAGDGHHQVERLQEQTQEQHVDEPGRGGYDEGDWVIELADSEESRL